MLEFIVLNKTPVSPLPSLREHEKGSKKNKRLGRSERSCEMLPSGHGRDCAQEFTAAGPASTELAVLHHGWKKNFTSHIHLPSCMKESLPKELWATY